MDANEARRLLAAERRRLLVTRAALQEDRLGDESEEESFSELSALDQHQADVGSEVFEREKAFSILALVERHLRDVDDAVARLDGGRYGTCLTCGRAIPDDRLEAAPATRFCAGHEALWEGRRMTLDLSGGVNANDMSDFADDISRREAARHWHYLPTDDDLEDPVELSAEEAAIHPDGLGLLDARGLQWADFEGGGADVERMGLLLAGLLERLAIDDVPGDDSAVGDPAPRGR